MAQYGQVFSGLGTLQAFISLSPGVCGRRLVFEADFQIVSERDWWIVLIVLGTFHSVSISFHAFQPAGYVSWW